MSQKIIEIEVQSHLITISGAISLKLLVSDEFEYIGCQEIIIYGTSKVYHYVFAKSTKNDQDKRIISKLFFLQYEYYLPEFMHSYNYKSTDIVEFGGILWQRDNFIDPATYDDWDPQSDFYQLLTFLEKKNLKHPDMAWNNRFATMLNKEKSQELLILYIEGIPKEKLETLFVNDKLVDDEWEKEKIGIKERSLAAFSIP
jgi:hypothetical protein